MKMLETYVNLVKTLPSKTMLLGWEGHNIAWLEITSIQQKRISTALQRGQQTQMWDL
jgi:hypothetical protein